MRSELSEQFPPEGMHILAPCVMYIKPCLFFPQVYHRHIIGCFLTLTDFEAQNYALHFKRLIKKGLLVATTKVNCKKCDGIT